MKKSLLVFLLSVIVVIGISCEKQGAEGFKSLIDIENISAGSNCPTGGLAIKTGIDKNRDNVLDPGEISDTKYVCNGESGTADKQIFLPFEFSGNTSDTARTIGGDLMYFSKSNYPGVDSIILVGNPYIDDASNSSIVELYNMTDDVPIPNSSITTNSFFDDRVFLHSPNIYSALPGKEIRLGISFRSANFGKFAASGSCYLILYRK